MSKRRWEDNIRMDLKVVVWVVVDWMHLKIRTSDGLLWTR